MCGALFFFADFLSPVTLKKLIVFTGLHSKVLRLRILQAWLIVLAAQAGLQMCARAEYELPNPDAYQPIDRYVVFVSPTNDQQQLVTEDHTYSLKRWTQLERREIASLLIDAYRKAPGLLHLSASNGKLRLYRIADIAKKDQHKIGPEIAFSLTWQAGIVVSDPFFSRDEHARILLHELVHAADKGCRVAYSKEWVNFANPIISKIRFRTQLAKLSFHRVQNDLKEANTWPSMYGTVNLKEALAEYISTLLISDSSSHRGFPQAVYMKLVHPSSEDVTWCKHYARGSEALLQERYSKAKREFEECTRIDSNSPMPAVHMAICHFFESKLVASLQSCVEARKRFLQNGVPMEEPSFIKAALNHATILIRLGKYTQAKEIVDQILLAEPLDAEALRSRGYCNKKLHRFGEALEDYFLAASSSTRSDEFRFKDIKTNPEEIIQLMSNTLKTRPTVQLWKQRIAFTIRLCSMSNSTSIRNSLCSQALEQLKSMDSTPDVLIMRTRLHLMMNDVTKAEDCCWQLIPICPDSLELQILAFRIMESKGESIAESQFQRLEQKIMTLDRYGQ